MVAWYGGWPPFLVFARSATLGNSRCTHPPRRLLPLLAVLGALLLTLSSMNAPLRKQEVCTSNGYAVGAFCWDVPEFSVLFTFIWRPQLEPGPDNHAVLAVRLGSTATALGRRLAAGWAGGLQAWHAGR